MTINPTAKQTKAPTENFGTEQPNNSFVYRSNFSTSPISKKIFSAISNFLSLIMNFFSCCYSSDTRKIKERLTEDENARQDKVTGDLASATLTRKKQPIEKQKINSQQDTSTTPPPTGQQKEGRKTKEGNRQTLKTEKVVTEERTEETK